MHKQWMAGLALACAATSARAADDTAQELSRRAVERRGVEAAIWGMPAVNYDLMLQEMLTKTSGKVKQAIYWGRPLDAMNQTLAPNPDALHFVVFFDTKDGPVVLDLPPGDQNGSLGAAVRREAEVPVSRAE